MVKKDMSIELLGVPILASKEIYHTFSSGMITLIYRYLTRTINWKDLLLIWKRNC